MHVDPVDVEMRDLVEDVWLGFHAKLLADCIDGVVHGLG